MQTSTVQCNIQFDAPSVSMLLLLLLLESVVYTPLVRLISDIHARTSSIAIVKTAGRTQVDKQQCVLLIDSQP